VGSNPTGLTHIITGIVPVRRRNHFRGILAHSKRVLRPVEAARASAIPAAAHLLVMRRLGLRATSSHAI